MCYATGTIPCSEACEDADRCLLSSGETMEAISICIAGGRDFDDVEYLYNCMESIQHLYWDHEVTIVSGACRGADEMGEEWGASHGHVIDSNPPDYKAFKGREREAPLARNAAMAKQADVLVAFWDGKSRGTRHMIGCAFKEGLEIHIFRYNNNKESRSDDRNYSLPLGDNSG